MVTCLMELPPVWLPKGNGINAWVAAADKGLLPLVQAVTAKLLPAALCRSLLEGGGKINLRRDG